MTDDIFTFDSPPISQISFTHSSTVKVKIGDCLNLIGNEPNIYDAIITDPPYCIQLHRIKWDSTDISFSPNLWKQMYTVLKPGGFIAAFSATRLYHRLASAAEDAGFVIFPFLSWKFSNGLMKPTNVSEMFDRANLDQREIIGYRSGSGYTKANVIHGAQNRSTTKFPIYARHVSDEAQLWEGYYYGVNCMAPCMEPILLAQKPIDQPRAIDNIRKWHTGALNLGALKTYTGSGLWPSTILEYSKAKQGDHGSDHPSVKPLKLMEALCLMLCPSGGSILDPFAGTGTTGVAAERTGFSCTLIENNPAMESVIARRLAQTS